MEQFRRGLRALVYAGRWLRSQLLLAYYRSLYSGLSVGKGVTIGRGVYLSVIRGSRLRLEDGVRLDRNAYLVAEGSITIGERTYVGVGATIVAKERIEIGRDGLIAAYATIRDQDHRTGEPDLPYSRQGFVTGSIEIGDNVWIGTKATILNGVSIGANSVIGANAVVTRSIEANVTAGGIPARVIRPVGKGSAGQ